MSFYFGPHIYEDRWFPVDWDGGIPPQPGLSAEDIVALAEAHQIPPAHLDALIHVEAGRTGFLLKEPPPARPKVLFEAHHMFRNSKHANIIAHARPDLCVTHWNRHLYKGGSKEWDRVRDAAGYDLEAALMSCSWGLGQIMGEHWKFLGYDSIGDFVIDAFTSEAKQAEQMIRFLQFNRILDALRTGDWPTVALRYNGSGYKRNQYDDRLAKAARSSELA